MLLSIVVNLLSSIYGTQSAPQAASPLVHHGGTSHIDTSVKQCLKSSIYSRHFWGLGNFPPKSYSSPPPNAAAKLGDLSLFSAETLNSPIYHGNFLLTDNKHRKLFVIKQSKGANLCQKMHQMRLAAGLHPAPLCMGAMRSSSNAGRVPTSTGSEGNGLLTTGGNEGDLLLWGWTVPD